MFEECLRCAARAYEDPTSDLCPNCSNGDWDYETDDFDDEYDDVEDEEELSCARKNPIPRKERDELLAAIVSTGASYTSARRRVKKLSIQQRQVLYLRLCKDNSVIDIGEHMKMRITEVFKELERAFAVLRAFNPPPPPAMAAQGVRAPEPELLARAA